MKRWPTKLMGAVCAVNPKLAASDAPCADSEVTFVPMAAVDEVSGSIVRPEHRPYKEVAKGYTPFSENDVLFAKITPCMQNGKAAVATNLCNGFGFGSTEFHVLRSTGSVLPRWVFAFIRQPAFRSAAEASFTGSAGQQRVPADFLKTLNIPNPCTASAGAGASGEAAGRSGRVAEAARPSRPPHRRSYSRPLSRNVWGGGF